jgi:hypothetical protein
VGEGLAAGVGMMREGGGGAATASVQGDARRRGWDATPVATARCRGSIMCAVGRRVAFYEVNLLGIDCCKA